VSDQSIYPAMRYMDARAAIAWLERAFGAEKHVVYDAPDGSVGHAQIRVAGNIIMLGESRDGDDYPVRSPKTAGGVTMSLYVALPDDAAVDALHARAAAAGATILQAPHATEYESYEVSVLDLDGHPWTFGTYRPETAG
jgi:uncharacterized glyoxalase superfamily protein PhnB